MGWAPAPGLLPCRSQHWRGAWIAPIGRGLLGYRARCAAQASGPPTPAGPGPGLPNPRPAGRASLLGECSAPPVRTAELERPERGRGRGSGEGKEGASPPRRGARGAANLALCVYALCQG